MSEIRGGKGRGLPSLEWYDLGVQRRGEQTCAWKCSPSELACGTFLHGEVCLLCTQLLRRECFSLAKSTHQVHFTLVLNWAFGWSPADRPEVGDPKDTSEQNTLTSTSQNFESPEGCAVNTGEGSVSMQIAKGQWTKCCPRKGHVRVVPALCPVLSFLPVLPCAHTQFLSFTEHGNISLLCGYIHDKSNQAAPSPS